MYRYDQKPGTKLAESSRPVFQQLRTKEYSVLVGRNNTGKSFLLKEMVTSWGETASYLGPARYQNFHLLGTYLPTSNRRQQKYAQFLQHYKQQNQNIDNSPMNLQQAIAELSDEQRDVLSEIVYKLLNVRLEIHHTDSKNRMSQQYISAGGHNISFTSSGFRLITTLLTSLLDTSYDTFLIDEPELGISPESQGVLADFLFDRASRQSYFAHIKTLVFATHSTVFLDRINLSNNYVVTKAGDDIALSQVTSQTDFNRVHFFLLGNRFETLYLPSAIVIVEGKSDYEFIQRSLALSFPKAQISVIHSSGDGKVKEIVNVAKGMFTDLQRSPYRDRIFVVLDSINSNPSLAFDLTKMGLPAENIVRWPKNGIEYLYPATIIDEIYGIGPELIVDGDEVRRNGIAYSKGALAGLVTGKLTETTPLHDTFLSSLTNVVAAKIGTD